MKLIMENWREFKSNITEAEEGWRQVILNSVNEITPDNATDVTAFIQNKEFNLFDVYLVLEEQLGSEVIRNVIENLGDKVIKAKIQLFIDFSTNREMNDMLMAMERQKDAQAASRLEPPEDL